MAPCRRCPAPDPHPSVTLCWFDVPVLGRTILEPRSGGATLLQEVPVSGTRALADFLLLSGPSPGRHHNCRCSLRPLLVPEPVPWWANWPWQHFPPTPGRQLWHSCRFTSWPFSCLPGLLSLLQLCLYLSITSSPSGLHGSSVGSSAGATATPLVPVGSEMPGSLGWHKGAG